MAMTKIGNVWVTTDCDGNIVRVHGTGLEPERVEVVVEEIGTCDPEDLVDPFTL